MFQSPSGVFNNYVKHCLSYSQYGLSYVDHVYRIIDNLMLLATDNDTYIDQLDADKRDAGVGDAAIIDNNIPDGISAYLNECSNSDLGVQCDFVIADKDRGFLNHHSADFSFIGPDREVTSIDNIQQYMHTADIIRNTGLPNYRQARIPLKSDPSNCTSTPPTHK